MVSLWLTVIAITLNNTMYDYPNVMPFTLMFIPPFNFCRIYYRVSHACGFDTCFSSLDVPDAEVWDCLKVLYLSSTFYLLLGLYLHEVVPQEFGVSRHPLFLLDWIKRLFAGKPRRRRAAGAAETSLKPEELKINAEGADDDCMAEEEFVRRISGENVDQYPLVVRGLRKEFPGQEGQPDKLAVSWVHFCIRKGETFGLLGPNGAGKTTLISMLTGMYGPTSGEAWIGGFSLEDELDKIQVSIGVCPQFDILWPELTVEEHLLFYARLKGVAPRDEQRMVDRAMGEVYLEKFRSFQTHELSGGMKRRLSVAISLVGNPRVVFLDEPSTGLDPENRRQLWDILTQSRGKRAIVLTTHSMEEADVLCNRIGIINHGRMRCLGSQLHLKNKFGGGYQLFVNCYQRKLLKLLLAQKGEKGDLDTAQVLPADVLDKIKTLNMSDIYKNAVNYVKELIPSAHLMRAFQGNFVFEVR